MAGPNEHAHPKMEDDIDIDDDLAFEEALAREASQLTPGQQRQTLVLGGAKQSAEKRKREDMSSPGPSRITDPYRAILSTSERDRAPPRSDDVAPPSLASDLKDSQEYLAAEAYKPNAFGDFATYMRHKRMKLKLQEHSMAKDEEAALVAARRLQNGEDGEVQSTDYESRPELFKNACIYINGHTVPPYAEMRRLIHLYGGELMPYLDQKTPVTHIIASNLTAKKRIEFKDYRVVRPEWVTESIAQGKRLDWRDFRCTEDAAGALQPGALGAQSRLDGKTDPADGTANGAAASALPSDWRTRAAELAAATAEGKAAIVGRTIALPAGTGSVGPWGAASRQKSLGSWARHPAVPPEVKQRSPLKPSVIKDEASDVIAADATAKTKCLEHAQDLAALPEKAIASADEGIREGEEAVVANDAETPLGQDDQQKSQTSLLDEEDDTTNMQADVRTPQKGKERDTMLPDKYYSTDPVNPELAALNAWQNFPAHPYASRPSNSKAAQLMASPSWRERNTATGEGFLEGYFGKSRLHHLSTWKSEMREIVGQALREADRAEGSVDLPSGVRRVIMHIDFDAFFVSVGLRARTDLHDKAVVVCHADSDTAGTSSTSEIASCNYIARTFGIRNGMSLGQARKFCNEVATIPYDFKAYNDVAICFYTLLLSHADAIEAVSIDEALIDVSMLLEEMRQGKDSAAEPARHALMSAYQGHLCSQGQRWTEEKQLAEALRDEIRAATGCEASIGIGSNVLLARIATRKAKPGGSFHLQDGEVSAFVDELEIDDLHGVGWSIRNRCKELFGTHNVGQLKTLASRSKFMAHFGDKHGVTIWDKLHGKERSRLESVKQRQSCGAAVNYAIRFKTDDEARDFVLKLCQEVSSRLQNIKLVGKVCCITLMVRSKEAPEEAPKFLGHGWCDTYNRSVPLSRATDDAHVIFENAWRLFAGLHVQADQMRGIGVSLQKLIPKEGTGFPAKREAGQRALAFKPAIKTPEKTKLADTSKESLAETVAADVYDDDLLDSPSAQRVVRLEQQQETALGDSKPSTRALDQTLASQFVIPPSSQLDPAVFEALPPSIQEQILVRRKGPKEVEKVDSVPESDVPASPAPSAPQTPRKQQKGKDTNLYTRLLAASTTPHRRGSPSRSQGKAHGHASVPSTPSGSQQRARQMEWEPTWSQVDQGVLAELPDDVREEVLRQIGQAGPSRGVAMSRVSSAPDDEDESPTKNASTALLEQKGLIGLMTRSHSESPRKRQAYLDVPGLRNRMAQPLAPVKGFGPGGPSALPPLLPNIGSHKGGVQAVSLVKAPDPATVTREELVALEIDPDVFTELPLSVQRETLQQQSRAAADRKARFKTGRHAMGVTLAQQRLQQRQSAMLGGAGGWDELRARPFSSEAPSPKLPSLKGLSTLDEVRNLLSTWFGQFSKGGPRERDVQRIARFFVECVESSAGTDTQDRHIAPRTRAQARSASSTDLSSRPPRRNNTLGMSQAFAIEKVYGLLQWWAQLIATHAWPEELNDAHMAWVGALKSAHTQVDAAMLARHGVRLSLGPLAMEALKKQDASSD